MFVLMTVVCLVLNQLMVQRHVLLHAKPHSLQIIKSVFHVMVQLKRNSSFQMINNHVLKKLLKSTMIMKQYLQPYHWEFKKQKIIVVLTVLQKVKLERNIWLRSLMEPMNVQINLLVKILVVITIFKVVLFVLQIVDQTIITLMLLMI